ncbi:ketopantoate reductase family protein [Novosphingobium mangrovi (ex Huang et al. 2023)]|uniref:Ketopantoate reductase N-terminal domain-containing protein n=1 Tax=Novosphingobium mangrovi (ex Huang et al. 2023) TaxID=2976432 RepID=A0ABT2I606_9SPHN|nr:2-dehydropantoate 2-reductase N-terminal domain-containing protein [Novosphingobium mangrovi (ex Huang et al. 2023)]MCT2400241.1 hypothetical protein [Novosphingobium mangrovi (ex Huang et al. 2023)]
MPKPSVLIVGAGALGIVTGYHLSLAGAGVHFLVRPNRLPALQEPQVLYCYDDHELKRFSEFKAHGSIDDAMSRGYDFVLITLDGATCRGTEGTALLKALGRALHDTRAIAVINGVGVREYCRDTMGLPDERVIEGTMGLLSYQTDRVTLPLNPPTDPARLAQASIGYRHMGKNPGFLVIKRLAAPARAFAKLYNRSGISKCQEINEKLFATFSSSIFVVMAMFDIAGWPHADGLARDTELMKLGSAAMKEVMRLPEHGLPGKIGSLFMSPRQIAKTNAKMERECLPVDYTAFNKFHHGGKVREQDMQVLQRCLHSGQAQDKAMPALTELLRRYEAAA